MGNQWQFTGDVGAGLNRLAREEMKLRLLRDIRTDLAVCEIEGWDKRAYIQELCELLEHFKAEAGL